MSKTSNSQSSASIRSLTTSKMAIFTQVSTEKDRHSVLVLNQENHEGAMADNQQGSDTSTISNTLTEGMSRTGLI